MGARLRQWLETALLVPFVLLFAWAAAVVFFQGIGWLRAGVWQPVPAYAALLSPAGQQVSVQRFEGASNALQLVPSIGNFESLDQLVQATAPTMIGMQSVLRWVLDLHFSLFLVAIASFLPLAWPARSR